MLPYLGIGHNDAGTYPIKGRPFVVEIVVRGAKVWQVLASFESEYSRNLALRAFKRTGHLNWPGANYRPNWRG